MRKHSYTTLQHLATDGNLGSQTGSAASAISLKPDCFFGKLSFQHISPAAAMQAGTSMCMKASFGDERDVQLCWNTHSTFMQVRLDKCTIEI